MSTERLYQTVEKFGRHRLGGSVTPNQNGVNFRVFDVDLDPALAPIWSVVFFAPRIDFGPGIGIVNNAQAAIGRLQLGQGGVASSIVEFDWGAGGIFSVPASNLQLDVFFQSPFPPIVSPFTAYVVPGVIGGTRINMLSKTITVPPTVPPFLIVTVPPFAKEWGVGAVNGSAVSASVLEIFILENSGATLERVNITYPADNVGFVVPRTEPRHLISRTETVFSVAQSVAGVITTATFKFVLAI
jgi:hypothetical protein